MNTKNQGAGTSSPINVAPLTIMLNLGARPRTAYSRFLTDDHLALVIPILPISEIARERWLPGWSNEKVCEQTSDRRDDAETGKLGPGTEIGLGRALSTASNW